MLTNKTFVTKEMLKTVIDQVGLAFRGYKNEDFEKHLKESDIKFKAIEDILGQALNVVSEILPNYQTGIKQNAANIAVLDKTIKDHKTELDAKDAELETAIDDKYTQAIAYVDEMYQKVLGGDVKEAYDTFKKLQDYIETHNTEFADVLASISALGAMDESLNSTITSNKEDVDAEIAELKANDETITSNIEQVRTDLIAYADNIHQTLLGEGVDEAYNTFKEFQTYVETHGDEIISIINRIDALEAKDTELEDVDAEVKAAFATISQAVGELQTNQNAIIDTLNGTDETTGLVPLTTAMSRIVNQHTEILKQVAYADSLDALHGIVTDNKAEVDGEITTLKESDTALEAKIDDREAALRGTYPERVNESDYDTLAKVATDVVDILTVITNQRDYNEKFFKDLGNVTNSKDAEDELLKKKYTLSSAPSIIKYHITNGNKPGMIINIPRPNNKTDQYCVLDGGIMRRALNGASASTGESNCVVEKTWTRVHAESLQFSNGKLALNDGHGNIVGSEITAQSIVDAATIDRVTTAQFNDLVTKYDDLKSKYDDISEKLYTILSIDEVSEIIKNNL